MNDGNSRVENQPLRAQVLLSSVKSDLISQLGHLLRRSEASWVTNRQQQWVGLPRRSALCASFQAVSSNTRPDAGDPLHVCICCALLQ